MKLTVANLVAIGLLLFTVGVAWARLEMRMDIIEAQAKESNVTLREIATSVRELSAWREAQTGSSTTAKRR